MQFSYQHHIVRDLAWVIASPPILIPEKLPCIWYGNNWYQELFLSSQGWLQRLDEEPQELQALVDSQKDRRLGRYFETLWAFWLEKSTRFEVIEQNLVLRDESKTLGELDFLLLDKHSGKILHWEVAVKFYLGVADITHHSNWHGPEKKDRLDLKVEHLLKRQSVISQRPEVKLLLQEMGYRVDACGVILKGRLYYPVLAKNEGIFPLAANPDHLRSYWLTVSEFMAENKARDHNDECFSPLLDYGWLASAEQVSEKPCLSLNQLGEAINTGAYRLPLHLSRQQKGGSSERFFVVSDDWVDSLMAV